MSLENSMKTRPSSEENKRPNECSINVAESEEKRMRTLRLRFSA
ncbi:hypothetical protein LINGRAHAP2_LOCUS12798 [Linum grandiflorum]